MDSPAPVIHHEKLSPGDAARVAWVERLRDDRPRLRWTTTALKAAITILGAIITNVPGRDGKRPDSPATAAAASGRQHDATAHAKVTAGPGHPAGGPAGTPGPESEPSGATVPAPATRLIPAADRGAAEVEATSPWQPREPFGKWESDTFVGGIPAIKGGA